MRLEVSCAPHSSPSAAPRRHYRSLRELSSVAEISYLRLVREMHREYIGKPLKGAKEDNSGFLYLTVISTSYPPLIQAGWPCPWLEPGD